MLFMEMSQEFVKNYICLGQRMHACYTDVTCVARVWGKCESQQEDLKELIIVCAMEELNGWRQNELHKESQVLLETIA